MIDKNEVIKKMKEQYQYLSTEFAIRRIGLFGSMVQGTLRDSSDIDLFIEFEQPIGFKFVELVEYLENLFGRKVDVITKDGIDNIRVKRVAENIKRNIVYVQKN